MQRFFTNTLSLFILLLCVLFLFERCAQVVPLSGGPRDTTAPILKEAVPSQASINFNTSEIVLFFNEYVQLRDLKNQLVISPKLKSEPDIYTEGKKVKITLKKEELTPNTTYRIYFGKAIADMTEGNGINNFEYVFSTGAYIDSLKFEGNVADAFTGKSPEELVVGLYKAEGSADSVIYKEAPDYLTRSTEGGKFAFNHLPATPFRVVAFTDKNKNYTYDGESEKIAFHQETINPKTDTSIQVKLFQEIPSRLFIKKVITPYYGKVNVIYNRKSTFTAGAFKNEEKKNVFESAPGSEKDTVSFYYTGIKDTLMLLITDNITKKADTVKTVLPKLNPARKKILQFTSNTDNGILPANSPLVIGFTTLPDTQKMKEKKMILSYKKDSVQVNEPAVYRFIMPDKAELQNKLTEGTKYQLKVDTASIIDFEGRYNDSTLINFRVQDKSDLGTITLKILFNLKQTYIIQLLNEREQVEKQQSISFSLSSSNATSIDFTGVPPGTYTTRIIFDDNANGKWDTGNYLQKKQPEKVFISLKQIKALPDWEVEEEILVK